MNGSGKFWAAQLVANMLVTVAFLAFAWYFRAYDKSIASLVIGASLTHWFRASDIAGRTVTRAVEGPTFNVPLGPPAEVRVIGGQRHDDPPVPS